jgi:homoserine O-succinyltransferase
MLYPQPSPLGLGANSARKGKMILIYKTTFLCEEWFCFLTTKELTMLILPQGLPAARALEGEGIVVIGSETATHQDIRPLKIVLLNLMPNKQATETQILRLLSHSVLQVEVTFLTTASYASQNTPSEYLQEFYKNFYDIREEYYDGLIITGAPLEKKRFEEVSYWKELQDIMEWSQNHVCSTMHICWAAIAGLYHHYGIQKHLLTEKLSGVYSHAVECSHPLTRGFDDTFLVPHSRFAGIPAVTLAAEKNLQILVSSEQAGVHLVANEDSSQVFILGHVEYEATTLQEEFLRDQQLGLYPQLPENYFPDNDPRFSPRCVWRGHGELLYRNWLYELYLKIQADS